MAALGAIIHDATDSATPPSILRRESAAMTGALRREARGCSRSPGLGDAANPCTMCGRRPRRSTLMALTDMALTAGGVTLMARNIR